MPEPTSPRLDVFVSIIAVLDARIIDAAEVVQRLHDAIHPVYANYEIVLVDNGVLPASLAELRERLEVLPCIRVLRLSREHDQNTAAFAGLEAAIGDVVVMFDPVVDPIDVIAPVAAAVMEGNDIVQGTSTSPLGGNWIGRAGRELFYWYNRRFLNVAIPSRATFLIGLSRRALNSLTQATRSHRYLRHLIQHIGYRTLTFPYTPQPHRGRRRSVTAGAVEAMEMISSYSTHPLRVVTAIGVIAGVLNLLYAVYVVIVNIVQAEVAEGWTTTSLQLSMMFFLICTILAVQSEYLGRILVETRNEQSYVIMEELESDVLIADPERRNVSS